MLVAVIMLVPVCVIVMIMPAAAGVIVMMVAVLVMVMIVIMSVMIVRMMVMPVTMAVPVIMPVIVAMRRDMLRIGAAFGIERRLDLAHFGAEPARHVGDHMVAANAQLGAHDLRRQMPVAEVPGDADQMLLVARGDLEQGFGRGEDFDKPPVLQR